MRGETSFVPLMRQAGKKPRFFRFPFNHTGDTIQKHEQVAAFLSQRGYRVATCTIDSSDYVFNSAYVRMLVSTIPPFGGFARNTSLIRVLKSTTTQG